MEIRMKSTMAVVILVLGLVILTIGLSIGGAVAGTDQTEVTPGSPVQRSDAPTEQESDRPPQDATGEFVTDFSLHSVPYTEIRSGGPPKDGIPSIDRPQFVEVRDADRWIRPMEPVIMLRIGPDVRAYPVQIVTWHEIINDTVGGIPVVVTFCPLCNTAIAFDRVIRGQRLEFGTTGRLRYSNLIMYDRQTESWWQQATGEAIAGELTGERLAIRPAPIVAWRDFKKLEPEGRVLSRRTGHTRPYGRNPYVGYDDVRSSPFMYEGPAIPGQLRPLDRVLALEINGASVAYPYDVLREKRVVNDTVGGLEVVVLWAPGTSSALDAATIAGGRDTGAAIPFSRMVDERSLTFEYRSGRVIDRETGSEWNSFGEAVGGELAGSALSELAGVTHFWFSWAAFRPSARIYSADD